MVAAVNFVKGFQRMIRSIATAGLMAGVMARVITGVMGVLVMTILVIIISPNMSQANDKWRYGQVAELQALDKITARISTLEANVGTPFQYGSLQIIIHACTYRPPTMAPEHAALMEIRTINHLNEVAEAPIFNGWMFASSPALTALEHSVYDVTVLACKKD